MSHPRHFLAVLGFPARSVKPPFTEYFADEQHTAEVTVTGPRSRRSKSEQLRIARISSNGTSGSGWPPGSP
jgi:hypothetical protein